MIAITEVFPAEICLVEIRARGSSLSIFSNWPLGLIIAQVPPISLADVGFRYFPVFFAFNAIAIICYVIFYLETDGRILDEMDRLFDDQVVLHALQDPKAVAWVVAAKFPVSEHVEQKE